MQTTLATLRPLDLHADHRGSFTEVFREEWFNIVDGHSIGWCGNGNSQASVAFSKRGVLRGMHRHVLHCDVWSVLSGRIQVGLCRRGKRDSFILEPGTALYIPNKTWHGFLALEDTTLLYLQDGYYDPTDEAVARWDSCGIEWTINQQRFIEWAAAGDVFDKMPDWPILSDRDRNAPTLEEVEHGMAQSNTRQ